MPAGTRKATCADVDQLVRSLACAFADDPLVNWIVRQDNKRSQAFATLFRTCLCALSLPHGQVLTTDDCVGGALWYPPGTGKITRGRQILLLPAMIRGAGFRGIGRLIHFMDTLDRARPKERHYYLQCLGVAPPHQRKGIGTALMRPVLDRCDREGCGAYLESSKEANVGYYERFGFVVTGEIRLGRGAPPIWPMWRAAQSSA